MIFFSPVRCPLDFINAFCSQQIKLSILPRLNVAKVQFNFWIFFHHSRKLISFVSKQKYPVRQRDGDYEGNHWKNIIWYLNESFWVKIVRTWVLDWFFRRQNKLASDAKVDDWNSGINYTVPLRPRVYSGIKITCKLYTF